MKTLFGEKNGFKKEKLSQGWGMAFLIWKHFCQIFVIFPIFGYFDQYPQF